MGSAATCWSTGTCRALGMPTCRAEHADMVLRRSLICTAAALIALLALAAPTSALGAGRDWLWPLNPVPPSVVRFFVLPEERWLPGHRGVDMLGETGQVVSAVAEGEVTFASPLAGRGVVVVRHGSLRSTYEPVSALVRVGEHVRAGQPLGTLQAIQSHCAPRTCLHLGIRRGEDYVDPLSLFGPLYVRLKPIGATPSPPSLPLQPSGAFPAGASKGPTVSRGGAVQPSQSGNDARRVGGAVAAVALATLLTLLWRAHARG